MCLSVCVYPSVPALGALASVETSKQRYSRVSLRLFLDLISGFSTKPSVQKLWREKSNMLELTGSRFRALSGPTKGGNDLKDNYLVE